MVKYIEGDHNAKGLRVGIVVSRFNDLVTSKLLSGALSALKENGADEENLEVVRVPGAFEIPQAAKKLCSSREFDAIVCLGAVIKGETPHFDFISAETSRGVGQVGLEFNIPVLFGVLTTNDLEQAIARTGSSNKGRDTALAAIEMVNLFRKI
ncbi:MAG: 6,7-dimethyl-8-ribityllumazine synthase [Nitrospina sp.]|jgi:6,7-dimethyl-8-ribityllumazine synthase|nr:6,7-dimethyl-8-ribityllumazine synthase [Nitrospina sp.]MBT5631973.1 6,7-dimethyl-8-ribityllumazine synthase [Nitrospina sp.]